MVKSLARQVERLVIGGEDLRSEHHQQQDRSGNADPEHKTADRILALEDGVPTANSRGGSGQIAGQTTIAGCVLLTAGNCARVPWN
jgi:hypothetical protein